MINGINTGINATALTNKDIFKAQNDNGEVKEKEQVRLSRAEEIKEQIKNGEYKIDLQKTAEKMASDLLNL